MIIPVEELNKETLYNLVESFVLREGTDYGVEEVAIEDKVKQVIAQLKSGEAVLMYSELHETVNIVSRDQVAKMQGESEESNDSPWD